MHLHIYFRTSSLSLFFIFYHRHVNIWLNSHSHSNGFVLWNSHSTNANSSWLRHIPINDFCLCFRHRKPSVPKAVLFSGVSVCEWVSLCVPKTLWTPYFKNQWREFHPVVVTDVYGFIDVLIWFWGQKVKGQAQQTNQKTGWIKCLRNYWSLILTK